MWEFLPISNQNADLPGKILKSQLLIKSIVQNHCVTHFWEFPPMKVLFCVVKILQHQLVTTFTQKNRYIADFWEFSQIRVRIYLVTILEKSVPQWFDMSNHCAHIAHTNTHTHKLPAWGMDGGHQCPFHLGGNAIFPGNCIELICLPSHNQKKESRHGASEKIPIIYICIYVYIYIYI